MYGKYGSYQHDDNEVRIVSMAEPRRRVRGLLVSYTKRVSIQGCLIPSSASQANIKADAQELENAYSLDGRDWALYHDDGTKSHLFLDNAGSHGGVRVVDFAWQRQDGADYATGSMQYNVTLEATYPVNSGAIIEYRESIDITGTGGPRVAFDECIFGPPQGQQVQQRTLVRASQRGSAVGFMGYVLRPDPLWPQWLLQPEVAIGYDTPTKDGNSFTDYPNRWSYSFLSPVPLFGVPKPR